MLVMLLPVRYEECEEEVGVMVVIGGEEYVYSKGCGVMVKLAGNGYGDMSDYEILHKEWKGLGGIVVRVDHEIVFREGINN